MNKAQEFRTITEKDWEENKKIKRKAAEDFWAKCLVNLEKCAREGRNYGFITVPASIDKVIVLELADADGFSYHCERSLLEYKISW